MNRIMIAGTSSGCGKTIVSTALLRAWQRRGIPLCAFKCGPDYIDPMFHQAAMGLPSYNLDLYFLSESQVRSLMAYQLHDKRTGVIEGVMGFYDGISGITDKASSAHLARATDTPVILVVRPKGQSLSLAAMLQGFRQFTSNTISGVIVNGISPNMASFYQDIIARAGLRSYGFLPSIPDAQIPDRHLGLMTACEIADLQARLDKLADAAEQGLDLDGLLALAKTAPNLTDSMFPFTPVTTDQPLRIAVARDAAFCFYYQDNFDVLTQMGAEIVWFSPLEDQQLPSDIDGLYLGGGYPELYAEQLSHNTTIRTQIANLISDGLPTIAECGGFLYLGQSLTTEKGTFSMTSTLPCSSSISNRLQPFGYAEMTAQNDGLLAERGQKLRVHEFHYAISDHNGTGFLIEKPNGRQWLGAFHTSTLYAGYPHLYFRSCPNSIQRFLKTCVERRKSL